MYSVMRKVFISAIFILLSLVSPLSSDAAVWSLDSCVSYAVTHNLTVKARALERDNAEISLTAAKDKYLPQLGAYASESFAFGRGLNSQNTYSDRNTSNFSWGANLSLPLFQGLSAKRGVEYAKVNLRQVVEQWEASKDDVTLNVISQYLQVLYTGELLEVSRLQRDLSSVELQRRRELLDAGKIAELEVLEAESQLAQDELSVVTAGNDRSMALLDLTQLLQLTDTVGFEVAPLDENRFPLLSADEVYANAMANNHSVLAARTGIEAAQKNISLAQTGYLPTLSFSAGIGSSYYHLSGIPNESFGSQMRNNLSKSLGFSLNIPIFDAFSTRNNIRRAKVQRLNAELQYEEISTTLYKSIRQAYFLAVGAEKKKGAALEAVKSTKAAFDAMQIKYNYGKANATEFEQAKTAYIRALAEELQARYESVLRLKILEFYNRH